MLEPEAKDDEEGHCLNRMITWHNGGAADEKITVEADSRHSKLIVK